MNRREYEKKLSQWEAEGYDVSELREKWFPAKKSRPFWFWVGLALFAGAEVTGFSVLISLAASGGSRPPTGNEAAFIISSLIIALGVLLIWLSRRKIQHGWFWPGIVMFVWGMGTIPMWVSVYLDVASFPNVPHEAGDLAAQIVVSCIPFIIVGTFCLWKGWPRIRVKHARVERLSFFLALAIPCLIISTGMIADSSSQMDILSFADNFDDGVANGWRLEPGWQIVNDNGNYVLEGQGQDYQCAWPRVTSAENYVLEMDFEILSGTFAPSVRHDDWDSRYIIWISENDINLGKAAGSDPFRLDGTEADISLGRWHNISIALDGGSVKVYIDHELKIDYRDEEPPPAGSFLIESNPDSQVRVDNIKITPPTLVAVPTATPVPAPVPVQTPIPTAVPVPTPEVESEILYEDDFSNPDSGWMKDTSEESDKDYVDGEYVIKTKAAWSTESVNMNTAGQYKDFILEVDAREISNSNTWYGLTFRQEDELNFYRFQIRKDGHYIIGTMTRGQWGSISKTTSNYILGGNSLNHLKVICQGSRIAAYVNGYHLATVIDSQFTSGYIGMLVNSPFAPAEVRFDNIRVYSADGVSLPD
jgi:hypothetical protein